jgi:hypothetical protein
LKFSTIIALLLTNKCLIISQSLKNKQKCRSPQNSVLILENYFKSCHTNNPIKRCQKLFMQEFGKKEVPSKRTVQTIISKFRQTGSVCDKKRVCKSSVLTADKMKQIEQSFVQTT